jgi:hypothetical protein
MSYADAMEDRIKALVSDKAELLAGLVDATDEIDSFTGDLHDEEAQEILAPFRALIAKHEAKPSPPDTWADDEDARDAKRMEKQHTYGEDDDDE